jgi:hypothetical protein
MVLEFPPELPNLELSELSELPDLSNLPDLDSDLSSPKSNTSADLGSDLDLDALLSLDSDLNRSFGTDFEKEFGFPEDTTDNSMEDLLNQMQADVDFSELGILDELEGIEGLEDLVMPEFDQPNTNLQTEDNSQVSGNAILEKMGSGDFDDLLEDFSTVETVVAVSQISADASEQESDRAFDQMFESQDELTFDLPDLDDGFVSSVEADSEPTSEPVGESLGEFIGSESIGFEDLDPFAETIETTSDSARQVEIPSGNFELDAQNLEDLDSFSSFDSDSPDSFVADSFGTDSFSSINDLTENSTEEILTEKSLTEENLIEETSNLGLPDLDSSLDNFLDDPLGNSNEDFSVVDALALSETVVTTEEPVEDPFATSWEQSSLESLTELDLPKSQLDSESNSELSLEQKLESFDAFSSLNTFNAIDNLTEEVSDSGFDNSLDDSFSDSAEGSLLDLEADLAIVETLVVAIEEPEYTVTHQDLADELEDDLQNSSLQSSTTEESFTAILAADSWSVEESRRAVEEDPFSDTFSQSLEETFEGSPIIGFTTILSSETESLLAPAEETNLERRPELAIAPSLPTSEESFQEPLVTKPDLSTLVVEPPIVQETVSEADLAEIEPLGLSYEQPVEPPIDDFTQILSSEQVESSLEPIDTLTPDTLTLDTLSSNDSASNASENPEPVQISQTDVRSNQLMGDVAVASAGVVSGVSTNSFAGSDRTGQPLQESLEQEMASEDSLNSESEHNENVDPYAGDESQSPWLKIGLAVALVIALIGGFALVRSNNNNNQPSQPTNQTNN